LQLLQGLPKILYCRLQCIYHFLANISEKNMADKPNCTLAQLKAAAADEMGKDVQVSQGEKGSFFANVSEERGPNFLSSILEAQDGTVRVDTDAIGDNLLVSATAVAAIGSGTELPVAPSPERVMDGTPKQKNRVDRTAHDLVTGFAKNSNLANCKI
jgi:hypothetical protein